MAALQSFLKGGSGFGNKVEKIVLGYDFASDGGAVGSLDMMEADEDYVVTDFYIAVEDALTSGGAATLEVGIAGSDELLTATAVGSFSAGALVAGTQTGPVKVSLADLMQLTIGTAALTAGKMTMYMKVEKFL